MILCRHGGLALYEVDRPWASTQPPTPSKGTFDSVCGICGIFHFHHLRRETDALGRMIETLVHRGPDDSGRLEADGAALGFRRLSIVDPETGNQPLSNEDGSVHLICNGEIFNERELRPELLERGHRFRSRSDVEVLLHLYEDLGEEMIHEIDGQFAFVVFDQRERSLWIARDPFGVVPFFYTVVGGRFVFGSEIKAILAHPAVSRNVDLTGLDQILSLPGLISPRTMFEDIHSLPPGHAMRVDEDGVRVRRYWDLTFPHRDDRSDGLPEAEYQHRLEELLKGSVSRRLRADVPVGAYLSGGLDSSLVVSLMRDQGIDSVTTFSITFEDQLLDEKTHQRRVADDLDCHHHEIGLGTSGIEERMRRVIRHTECPLKESYDAASLALSESARRHGVPVVLCGEGADELFAGYLSYRFDVFRRQSGRQGPTDAFDARLRRRVWGDENFFYERDLAELTRVKRALYSDSVDARFDDFDFTRHPLVDREKLRHIHPMNQRAYLDVKLRLGDHLLGDHGDRMLLANSVEGRFPFLDTRIADLACRLPPDLKLRGYQEKYILRQVARDYVPKEIFEREKYGFNAPASPQLLQAEIDWVEDLLCAETIERQGYFDVDEVERLKQLYRRDGFRLSIPNEDDLLMVVLTFGLFLEEFDMPSRGR